MHERKREREVWEESAAFYEEEGASRGQSERKLWGRGGGKKKRQVRGGGGVSKENM